MDVLRNAHRALRPGGVVLDLQPEPGDPSVEVVVGGRVVGAAPQDEAWYSEQILKARAALEGLVAEGLFVVERRVGYEWLQHAGTIGEWAAYRATKGMTPLDEGLVARLRALGADEADEVRKRERCRATRLRRL